MIHSPSRRRLCSVFDRLSAGTTVGKRCYSGLFSASTRANTDRKRRKRSKRSAPGRSRLGERVDQLAELRRAGVEAGRQHGAAGLEVDQLLLRLDDALVLVKRRGRNGIEPLELVGIDGLS